MEAAENTSGTPAHGFAHELGGTGRDQNKRETIRRPRNPSKSATFRDNMRPNGTAVNDQENPTANLRGVRRHGSGHRPSKRGAA
jgi:hypothetical protein